MTIEDDEQSEMKEDFILQLRFDTFTAPPSGVTLSPNMSVITIEDDDGMLYSVRNEYFQGRICLPVINH